MIRKLLFWIVFWIIFSGLAFSQIVEDFTDGEIHTNPVWSGDTSMFRVVDPGNSGDGSLAAGANDDGYVLSSDTNINDAVITTANTTAFGEWIFSVADGAGWSLSGTNNYNIILVSDQDDVTRLKDGSMDFNGYFIHRGCSSCDDVFELYRQDSSVSTLILNTAYPPQPDGTGAENGHSLKITRNNAGIWKIFINEGFDTIPYTQRGGDAIDTAHLTSSFFGISTNISNASEKRVLYFDNLQINNNTLIVSPPTALNIDHVAPDKMNISWNKPVGVFGAEWDGVVVFAREDVPNDADVSNSDGLDFIGDTIYGNGSTNNNSFCIANQDAPDDGDIIISGLSVGLNYYFIAYAYKEVAGDDNDIWSAATMEINDVSKVKGVSNFNSFSGQASVSLTWNNYTFQHGLWWDEVMIVGKLGMAVDQSPTGDGANYFANSVFGSGTELGGSGTGNFVLYKDIGDSIEITNLLNDSIYFFRAFVRYDTIWTGYGEYKDVQSIPSSNTLFFTEISDPLDNYNARFVEIFNSGDKIIDLDNENWHLGKQTNGSSWDDILLSGKVYPGCTYVISYNQNDFVNSYFFQPDYTSGVVSGNGDDGYFLYKGGDHNNGKLVDSYGVIDQDGSGTLWEYTDSRVVRKDSINAPSAVWDSGEWLIIQQSGTSEMEPGRHKDIIRWQGSVSVDWNDGSNWSGGIIPDSVTDVVITGTNGFIPVVSGIGRCNNLVILPSGKMNISNGGDLNLFEDILIEADATGTGSLITEGTYNLQYSGELSIEKYFSSNDKWHYFSPAVNDIHAGIFTSCYLNSWDETIQSWEHITDPSNPIEIAKGYSVKPPLSFGSKATLATTTGEFNSGVISTTVLTYTFGQDSSLNGFNLIGNPYPSSIDWDNVNIPASVDAAIYYWDPSAGIEGMYKSYVPGIGGSGSRNIPPMHGFFIHASDTGNGAVITFDDNVRVHQGQTVNYKQKITNDVIKIACCGNTFCDQTLIRFSPNATDGFDGTQDAYKLFSNDPSIPQIYTRIPGVSLSVSSLPLKAEGTIIPIGFKSGNSGIFKLSIDQPIVYNPDYQLFLKDLKLDRIINLNNTSSYSFSHQPGNDPNRFLLYVNYFLSEHTSSATTSLISVVVGENEIVLNNTSDKTIQHVDIFNTVGQRIKTINSGFSSASLRVGLPEGIYLIRILIGDEVITEKIIIR